MIRGQRSRHNGFTVVELLTVIAVIAILASLILGAVGRVREAAQRVQATSDIAQLGNAIAAFKAKFNVGYIPSHFEVKGAYDTSNPTDAAYFAYLKQLFPPLQPGTTGLPNITLANGNECLVFFLSGGVPASYTGFSSNKASPLSGSGSKIGPFFDFPASRLRVTGDNRAVFLDPWGSPYAYFTAVNGNDYGTTTNPLISTSFTHNSRTVSPFQNGGRFEQQKGFQIISAGPKQEFGPGGNYVGHTDYAAGAIGGDDIANFTQAGNLQQ